MEFNKMRFVDLCFYFNRLTDLSPRKFFCKVDNSYKVYRSANISDFNFFHIIYKHKLNSTTSDLKSNMLK